MENKIHRDARTNAATASHYRKIPTMRLMLIHHRGSRQHASTERPREGFLERGKYREAVPNGFCSKAERK